MHRFIAVLALTSAVVLAATGCSPKPPDIATISAVEAPTTITRGAEFQVDVYAEDLGSPEYAVVALDDRAPAGIEFHGTTCTSINGGPSADGNWCEYDANTNSTRSITESSYRYVWTGAAGAKFSLEYCAASFTNSPDPMPEGGSCVTRHFTVAP